MDRQHRQLQAAEVELIRLRQILVQRHVTHLGEVADWIVDACALAEAGNPDGRMILERFLGALERARTARAGIVRPDGPPST